METEPFLDDCFDSGESWLSSPDLLPEFEPALREVYRSAFWRYDGAQMNECSISGAGGGGSRNIHRRVVEMLKRIPKAEEQTPSPVATSRGFKHMMRERQRREKLSQSYADLYSMIALRSKSDKNSIVQSATQYVRELKGVKKALQQRNEELKAQILGSDEAATIKIRVENPSSPIDSMIGALRCLQSMGVTAKAVRSDLSRSEFSATMAIDTKIETADVEKAMERVLMEVEEQLHDQLPGSRPQQCPAEI